MSECNCVDTGHKQDCPLGKDLRIAAMQEQIAILETSLAERWESLNVQDGIIDGLQEEIAALRKTIAEAVPTLDQFVSEVAHAQASGSSWYTRGAAGLYGQVDMWRRKAADALAALREAGYLKEDGDVLA